MLVLSLNKHIDNSFTKLLAPSWLSVMVAGVTSLGIVFGSIAMLNYRGSYTHFFYDALRHKPQEVDTYYQELATGVSSDTIASSIPLLILWAVMGFIAYSFTNALIKAFKAAHEIQEEMDYVNIDRHTLITEAVERLIIRVIALIVWIILIRLTIDIAFPYILAVTYAGSSAGNLLLGSGYVALALIITAFCCHIHTILLRLISLRPRMFGQ